MSHRSIHDYFDEDFLARLQGLHLIAKRVGASPAASRRGPRTLGDGLEFADHRAYAPGDDIRFLDWPYYARMERLLLRLFHEHSEGAVGILLDASGSMSLGQVRKFDYARRTAAAMAYVAMGGLDRVEIVPFGQAMGKGFKTGRNRNQILQVLDFLESLEAAGPTELGAAIEQYLHGSSDTGMVILLTDAIDVQEDLAAALALLRRQKDEVVFLHVVDRCDARPEALGPTQLDAIEAAGRISLNLTDELLAGYRQRWRTFARGLERTCMGRGAVYVQAPTSAPFERLVLKTVQRVGMLQA
ncbi:hypothetical protein LCGC14_1963140 [marine sediment metagenome]|uniref:DUF58 domain-containing protein n=1 Tax=marine sediment metagenome TaxID=412755 RepID=A0A0F9G2B9_9ZZZZ